MNALRAITASMLAVLTLTTANGATFSVRSTNVSGGLNDTTPFTPVGGNNATTLGEARMNVLREAARIWGTLLQSNVTVQVDAAFNPLTCSSSSGTLGSAGPRSEYRNVAGASSPDIYYVSALADALSGSNLSPDPTSADIIATFSSTVDSDPTCLHGFGFYYGLDHNRGSKFDLLLVVLHEFGHGLGFTSDVDLTTGKGFIGSDSVERFDSFTTNIFDETANKAWPAMTAAERLLSATNTGHLAWNGTRTNAQSVRFTQGVTSNGRVRLYAPATISSGSSVSHWDSAVTPSVLMEPNLPSTITSSSTDITVCALADIGWNVTQCPHFATNRAPVADAQSVTTLEDAPITITLTGTDADNDPLFFTVATPPTRGTLSAISQTTPHTITFTPNANINGSDSFTFTVDDGAATSSATVAIAITPVNDPPTAADLTVTTQTTQAANITLQGSDVDSDSLTYIVVGNPSHGALSGQVNMSSNLVYQATSGYVGSDSFTYRVNDGTVNSAIATVSINVQSPPQVIATASSESSGGGALSFALLMTLSGLIVQRRRPSRLMP